MEEEQRLAQQMSQAILEILGRREMMTTPEVVEILQEEESDLVSLYFKVKEPTILGKIVRDVRHADKEKRKRHMRSTREGVDPLGWLDYKDNVERDGKRVNLAWGDFEKRDHLTKASEYNTSAAESLWWEAFHKAVASKVPKGKRTRDVLTDEELDQLMNGKEGEEGNAISD